MASPAEADLPPRPTVSMHTMAMAGLLVDVHGLDELHPSATRITCLWLHHQRLGNKERMADVAARCVASWNERSPKTKPKAPPERGLIALAFDQRNHGTRLVSDKGNESWNKGNETHAQDMFGIMAGAVVDQGVLIDLAGSYLFRDQPERLIDRHLGLGVSMGGHSVWQLMFAEPRVSAAVVVVGCPDFTYLISDRAKRSKLSTTLAEDGMVSFLGSKDFPPSLVEACRKYDPKCTVFGLTPVPEASSSAIPGVAGEFARQKIEQSLSGKKFLLCSGGEDKLVPYRCSEPFVNWLKDVAGSWLKHCDISVEDKIYPGVGHTFDVKMIEDAVRFVVDNTESPNVGSPPSKI